MSESIHTKYIPNYEDFCYRFSKDECYKESTGTCPVENNIGKLLHGIDYETSCKCEDLMRKIVKDGFIEKSKEDEILVVKCTCGEYGFSNGRHRTCAASKLKIPITIHIADEISQCTCDKFK